MVNAGLTKMSYTTRDTVTVGSRPARSNSELLQNCENGQMIFFNKVYYRLNYLKQINIDSIQGFFVGKF